MENGLVTKSQITFTDDQVSLIKKQIAPRATDDELKLFLYQAKRTGLDPLARQIYCIHRAGKMTVQTSIDGFRVVAERTGDYGGQDEPEFIEVDGKLICCKVSVYKFRGDIRYKASVGVAYWDEYFPQDNNFMWKKMPHTMLSKVAEALALRKAYPQDLSGLYTNDEMQQANEPAQANTDSANDYIKSATLPERTCEELKEEYMGLLAEYIEKSKDPKAKDFHPDNWKKEQNINTFTAAIAAIKLRLNGLSGRAN